MHKNKPTYLHKKEAQNTVNKKGLIWTVCIVASVVILMSVLLIFNR